MQMFPHPIVGLFVLKGFRIEERLANCFNKKGIAVTMEHMNGKQQ